MPSTGLDIRGRNLARQSSMTSDVEKGRTQGHHKEYSFDDAISLIGFGRMQVQIMFACGIMLMAVLNETMGINILTIASQCDFNTTSQDKALINAASFAGVLVASYPWGYIADVFGRRVVLLYAMLISVIFSLLSMLVSNLWVFIVMRFLTGIGIGGAAATVYAYLGEFNNQQNSVMVINYASTFVGISTAYVPAVAWLILPQSWSFSMFGIYTFRPWRLLILFNLLPGLFGMIWIWNLPESPRFLLSRGKNSEALRVLQEVYETNYPKSKSEFPIKQLASEVTKDVIESLAAKKTKWEIIIQTWKQTIPLFKPPYLRNFIVCCFIMFGLFFTSNGLGLWFPDIQNRLGLEANSSRMMVCQVIQQQNHKKFVGTEDTDTECSDEVSPKAFLGSIYFGTLFTLAFLILGIVIRVFGRKLVLIGSLIFSGGLGLSLLWIYDPILLVGVFAGFLLFPGICISVLSGAVVGIIPTHLRGKAICTCLMIGRLGCIIGSNLVGSLLDINCSLTFYIFAGYMLLCAVLVVPVPL